MQLKRQCIRIAAVIALLGALCAVAGPVGFAQSLSVLDDAASSAALSSAAASGQFGAAVVVRGEWVLVGQPFPTFLSENSVYAYRLVDGEWVAADTLRGPVAGEEFGASLALEDGRLFVGAPRATSGAGAVYVFEVDLDNGTWSQSDRLEAAEAVGNSEFGTALDVDGDMLVVGAPFNHTGRAYVFLHQPGGGWMQDVAFENPRQDVGHFGSAVAVAGPGVVVGARYSDNRSGRVFSFARNEDTGAWSSGVEWAGSDVEAEDRFGHAVAGEGNHLVVGSPYGSAAYAFTYREETGVWKETDVLRDADAGFFFGWDVAMAGDELLVGVYGDAAYLYRRNADDDTYAGAGTLEDPTDAASTGFGYSVSLTADAAAVGARSAEKALLYDRSGPQPQLAETFFGGGQGLARIEGAVPCTGGFASVFPCRLVDLLAFLPIRDLGTDAGKKLNDIWGWTDPETGTEYALVGLTDGTAFVDLSDPKRPELVGNLPTAAGNSTWRDVKVIKDHAVVVADNAGEHGMQVFDLSRLREVTDRPVTFEATAVYDGFDEAHNIIVNEDAGHAYGVGITGAQAPQGAGCGPGLHIVDMSDPANPSFAGCHNSSIHRGYTHDAQCLRYQGPDADYDGRDLCFGADERGISITDVTDPAAAVELSTAAYPDAAYTHQAWLTEDHRYLLVNDELDEATRAVDRTRTLIFDVIELGDPVLVGSYFGETGAIDHNLYVRGNLVFEANYTAGLRILAFDAAKELTDGSLDEVAFFDVYPRGDFVRFSGAWSSYPFFESGIVVVSGIESGLFVLRPTLASDVAVEDAPVIGTQSRDVLRAYPNPAASSVTIVFDLERSGHVRIDVYDLLGRRMQTLFDGRAPLGRSEVTDDLGELPNGTYFVRLSGGGVSSTISLILQR